MQVSWIDPEEIKALVAQIEGPKKTANASAWEVHTLPIAPLVTTEAVRLLSGTAPDTSEQSEQETPTPAEETGGNELSQIRERLRQLRERAQESGILPKPEQQPPPAPATFEAPRAEDAHAVHIETEDAPLAEEQDFPVQEEEPLSPAAPSGDQPSTTTATDTLDEIAAPESLAPPAHFDSSPPADFEPLFAGAVTDLSPAEETMVESAPVDLPATAEQTESASATTDREPAFVPPELGLGDRLAAFAGWACDRLDTRDLMLVDAYGDVLWGGQAQSPLVLSALMAWQSAQHASAPGMEAPRRLDRDFSDGRALTILSLHTTYGVVHCAVVVANTISEDTARLVLEALERAIEGPAATSAT